VIGDATIHDAHPEGALTVAQVVQKSSNVGAAKLALALPREVLWKIFSAAGFGSAPQLGFPAKSRAPARLPALAPDRAGDDVLWPRHIGEPSAACARLHRVRNGGRCSRSRSCDTKSAVRRPRDLGADRLAVRKHARAGGQGGGTAPRAT
jgi:cell division protein FtsI (penicillin-binding protein 3)